MKTNEIAWRERGEGKRCRMTNRVPDPDAGVGCVLLMGLVLIALAIVFLFALLIRAFI